jgi:hypothetical protein
MSRNDWKRPGVGLVAFMALSGCEPALPTDPPSNYEFDPPEIPPPQDAAAISQQVGLAISEVLTLDPLELFSSYDAERTSLGDTPAAVDGDPDGTCPDYDVALINSTSTPQEFAWDAGDGCDAPSGARFQGNANGGRALNFVDPDDATVQILDAYFLDSSSRIFEPGGVTRFDLSIGMNYTESAPVAALGDRAIRSSIDGSAFWNGNGSGNVWLSTLYSLDLDVDADVFTNGNKRIELDGIVSGLSNSGTLSAIIFNDIEFAIGPLTCQLEPAGNMLVRDNNGYWYEMNFQGSRNVTDDEVNDPECDGIGTFSILDTLLPDPQPTVNPNFTSLSSWGGRPWQ